MEIFGFFCLLAIAGLCIYLGVVYNFLSHVFVGKFNLGWSIVFLIGISLFVVAYFNSPFTISMGVK